MRFREVLLIGFIAFFIGLAKPAYAQSERCDTRLSPNDTIRVIERIFECQQRQIDRLQARIEELENTPQTEETGAPQPSEQRVWNGVGFQLLGCQPSNYIGLSFSCTFLLSTAMQREFELSADLFRAQGSSDSLMSGSRVEEIVGSGVRRTIRYSLSPEMTASIVVHFRGSVGPSRRLQSITVGGRLLWRDVPIAQ